MATTKVGIKNKGDRYICVNIINLGENIQADLSIDRGKTLTRNIATQIHLEITEAYLQLGCSIKCVEFYNALLFKGNIILFINWYTHARKMMGRGRFSIKCDSQFLDQIHNEAIILSCKHTGIPDGLM